MIKVTMRVNDTAVDYEISSMETLAKFQAQLTEEVTKNIKPEISEEDRSRIIREYFEDVEQGVGVYELVEEICNNQPNVYEKILEDALRDTDYSDIDEITVDIDRLKSAMEDIYSIARDWC